MARISYVQIGGVLYDKSKPLPEGVEAASRGANRGVFGDLPDFVSPIDGTVVSGRAGLRDHCKKHDVVPTADLKGLPTGPQQAPPDRAGIREALQRAIYKH